MKRIKRTHHVALGLLLGGAFTLASQVGLAQSSSPEAFQVPVISPKVLELHDQFVALWLDPEAGAQPPDDGLPGTTADVDKVMGVLPSPGASEGDVITNVLIHKLGNKPSGNDVGMEMGGDPDPDDERSAKGIGIGELKPGALPSLGASKGIIGADKVVPPNGAKPGEGSRPPRKGLSSPVGFSDGGGGKGIIGADNVVPPNGAMPGGIAAKGLSPIISAPGMLPAGKMPPTVLPAGKGMMTRGK